MWKPAFDDVTEENIDHAIEQGNELYDSHYRILHINAFDNQVWIVAERGRVNNVHKISDVFEKSKIRTLSEMDNNEINDLEIFGLGFVLSNEKENTKIDANELVKDLCCENELNKTKDFITPEIMNIRIRESKWDESLWHGNKLNRNKDLIESIRAHSVNTTVYCNDVFALRLLENFSRELLYIEFEAILKKRLLNFAVVGKYFHEARLLVMISDYVECQCKSNTESENRDNLPAVISQR